MPYDVDAIRTLAAELAPSAVALRRDLHAHPELGHEEVRTTAKVIEALEAYRVPVRPRVTRTGLTAELGDEGPLVAFRADLDALPIVEMSPVEHRSTVEGLMHACGHDAHTAIGTYAAILLHRLGLDHGRARFIFQPAEEVFPGGAVEIIRDGLVDGVEAIMAFHVDPSIPARTLGLRAGTLTASSDRFEILVEGPGGHTARPHETVDTIATAARIVNDVPRLLHEQVDLRKPLVMVFGRIGGGHADNVIPASVELSGTCRTGDRDLWDSLPSMIEPLIRHVGEVSGAKITVRYQRGIPPVVNDRTMIDVFRGLYTATFGSDNIRDSYMSMGAEDFARYLDSIPGTLVRLGVGFGDRSLDLHSASFDMDESAIETGIAAAAVGVLGLIDHLG